MHKTPNADIFDTVLTLRGHQITLRQAMAEGIIKGRFDPVTGSAEVLQVDSDWIIDKPRKRNDA